MDHIGCTSCGYSAKAIKGIRQGRCPRCAATLEIVSADEAWGLLRERVEALRAERAMVRRRRGRTAPAARRTAA